MFSSVLLFFDIGGGEILLIGVVALLLFGGEKLPELARGLGKGIRDFKDASEGVKREINSQIDNFEAKKAAEKATEPTPVAETTEPETKTFEPVQNTIPVAALSIHTEAEPETVTQTPVAEHTELKETPIEPENEAPAKTAGEHKA